MPSSSSSAKPSPAHRRRRSKTGLTRAEHARANLAKIRASGVKTGRKPGVPNKRTLETLLTFKQLVEDPLFRKNMLQRLRDGREHAAVVTMLCHYVYGKPKEVVTVDGSVSFSWLERPPKELPAVIEIPVEPVKGEE